MLHLELSFSIVLSALASATAPASTMMTIRQTGAHGDFVDTLLQVVALDDVVGLILYSVAISVAMASQSGSMQLSTVIAPILANICVLALGALFGVIWIVAAVTMGAPWFFALFGVAFVGLSIANAAFGFHNAFGKNRYSSFDITEDGEEPDPFHSLSLIHI